MTTQKMIKDYQYFHKTLIAWYQGEKTGPEIRKETSAFLILDAYKDNFDVFIDALEQAIDDYDDDIGYEWEQYKEYAQDTAPTIKGLCHSIEQVLIGNLNVEEFIDWATWHNIDCGESTSGVFENDNIETFCLDFLPEHQEQITTSVLNNALPIIKESSVLSKDEFSRKLRNLI